MKSIAQIKIDMDEILKVRYSDPEQEKSLCLDLLEWEKKNNDNYTRAFAYTYLGDYYLSLNSSDRDECVSYLMKAREISSDNDYYDLLVRIYNSLGLYYNSIADDQSAIEYYIEGIAISRKIEDKIDEALLLNNIGYNLVRRHGYKQALFFYRMAYDLLYPFEKPSNLIIVLLNNLATALILLNELEEAKTHIITAEEMDLDGQEIYMYCCQNWCQYYAAKKDEKQALHWVDKMFEHEQKTNSNNSMFDIYLFMFDSIMQLQNKEYAKKILLLMEKNATNQSFLQHQELEIRRMQFSINFEDKDKQDISYKHYAKHIQELDDIRNTTITKGLTEAIDYLKVKSEKEYLNNENKYLDTQMNIDELTKVFTRHYLDVLMEKYTKINFNSVGFIMFDLDCLKEYNDTYGHVDGDYVLHYIGSLLNLYKREGIHPCRFGGDEFVCLCINCTDDQIENYVKEIRKDLHDRHLTHLTSSCAKEVTLSIGYCNTQNNKNMNKIFELADQALYQAKQKGRNTYCKLLG